jgi:hypothetical protein
LHAQTQITPSGWRTDKIYHIGNPHRGWDMANFVVSYGLYDDDGTWVADIGRDWLLEPSWYVLRLADGPIPESLGAPFGDLQALERVLKEYLASTET